MSLENKVAALVEEVRVLVSSANVMLIATSRVWLNAEATMVPGRCF